jgi:hypothetical protein
VKGYQGDKKLARFTKNLGINYLESWPELLQGAYGGTRKICTEGVKIAHFFLN